MADDDETMVRHRLLALLGSAEAEPAGRVPRRTDDPTTAVLHGPTLAAAAVIGPAVGAGPEAPDFAFTSDVTPQSRRAAPEPTRLGGVGVFDPGRRGVKALAAVAVLVVLGAAVWAWRSRPTVEPVPVASSASRSGATTDPRPASPGPGGPSDPVELVVAVAGKVHRPGLVRLPAGARVADAIQAAGGALPGVDVTLINPARKVTDGELIVVGAAQPPAAPGAPGSGPLAGVAGGKVNLNTATLAQLDALPGVGPVLAQRILNHREQHGGFRSVGDLRQVDGIGDSRYQDLKDLVTV